MNRKHISALLCAIFLTGCSGTKESLGLTKASPDEFAVVRHAPLSMPPDYALRPPRPGAPRPQESAPIDAAAETVFGSKKGEGNYNEDAAFLNDIGAVPADTNIRDKIDAETARLDKKNIPVAKKILNIGSSKPPEAPSSVVNAKEESARIQKNKEEGKSVTTGETPSIEK
jgi:hypothetical protein